MCANCGFYFQHLENLGPNVDFRESVRLIFVLSVAFEESLDVFRFKSAVTAVAKSVGLEQASFIPLPDRIGMHMEKVSYLRYG